LTEAICAYDRRLGCPDPFQLVELGSGEGVLAGDILKVMAETHPGVRQRARYIPIEVESGQLPESICGVVFSNEFFDALPVHRVRVRTSELKEVYVVSEGSHFEEIEGDISDPRIRSYMQSGFETWKEGWSYEVNLRMLEVLSDLDRRIRKGAVITVDYGYDWAEYDSVERSEGTLLCYHQHEANTNPYQRIGEQDITAHVNFEVMRRSCARRGWKSQALKTQREFLFEWGLEKRLLEEEPRLLWNADHLEERLDMKRLLLPGGISDALKVLVQEVRISQD
jgi:SAM-dependent MidA family methyltransferase